MQPRLSGRVAAALLLVLAATVAACGGGAGYPRARPYRDPGTPTGYPAPGDAAVTSDGADAAGVLTTGSVQSLGGAAIKIGTDATYPPMESVDTATGAIVGFDPDLMQAICDLVDCLPTFEATQWEGIFAALAAREYDALMSSITILPEREASGVATFTDPYYSVGQVIVARADDSAIADVASLADAVVGVQKETTGDTAATEQGGVAEANMRRFPRIDLAFQALKNGDVDAVVCDDPTAQRFVGADPGAFRLAGAPFTQEDYGILVAADRTDLLAAFNAAIAVLKADGTIDTLLERWNVGGPAASGDAAEAGAAASGAVTTTGAAAPLGASGATTTTGATAP